MSPRTNLPFSLTNRYNGIEIWQPKFVVNFWFQNGWLTPNDLALSFPARHRRRIQFCVSHGKVKRTCPFSGETILFHAYYSRSQDDTGRSNALRECQSAGECRR